jgi:mannose-1-phosphate guanylyltransferase
MDDQHSFTRVGIIMAGGAGERFWPLSRSDHPKQLLKLTHTSKSMLHLAVERLTPLIAPEHVYVITSEHLVQAMKDADIGLPEDNILAEPAKRNTAGCLIYAAAHILAHYEGDGSTISMAIVTADHIIENEAPFRAAVDASLHIAETQETLVTHGIVPTRPDTSFGYIQASTKPGENMQVGGITMHQVTAFHEKPNKEKAGDFIDAGNYYWNSGMFFWRLDTFISELRLARPDMAETLQSMAESIRHRDKGTVTTTFEQLESISIDYALMEHTLNIIVTRAEYEWDDVGSWPSLDRTHLKDENGNVSIGAPVLIDTTNSIIYNEPGAEDMAVSVVGMKDVVVVVSKDGILVVPKDHAQHVRHAVKELKARGAKQI